MARFFYTPKPRQFDYKPRYWDPEKEAREKRREELLGARPRGDGEYVPGELLRNRQMQRRMAAETGRARRRTSGRTVVLIALLLLLGVAVAWVLM